MMAELKPCPFCGSKKIQYEVHGYHKPWESNALKLWFKCSCYECGVSTDEGSSTDMTKAEKVWNERWAEDGKV